MSDGLCEKTYKYDAPVTVERCKGFVDLFEVWRDGDFVHICLDCLTPSEQWILGRIEQSEAEDAKDTGPRQCFTCGSEFHRFESPCSLPFAKDLRELSKLADIVIAKMERIKQVLESLPSVGPAETRAPIGEP